MDQITLAGYYKDGVNNIKNDLDNIKKNYLALGYHLREIRDNKWFTYKYYDVNFTKYCKDEFGFSKSTVYRLIEMVDKFCKPDTYCLIDKYKDYNQSQLVEMLSMSDNDLGYVRSDMTVKEIRSIKSYESKPKSDVINRPCKVVPEPDEVMKVATSQQIVDNDVYIVYCNDILNALEKMKDKYSADPENGEKCVKGYCKAISDLKRTLNIIKKKL